MTEKERITTLERIKELAEQKRSIISNNGMRLPAAVILNMTGMTILKFIKFGMFVYEKQEKEKNNNGNDSD